MENKTVPQYKIDILADPHPWDNPDAPYFWCILKWVEKAKAWCNDGCGWAASTFEAYRDAAAYLNQHRER